MPHPVLGVSGDIKEGFFNTSCKIRVDKENRQYKFEGIVVDITNQYIQNLYNEKKVDLILKICCSPTYKSWTFTNPKEISIPENEIDILIEIESFLIAAEKIEKYIDITFSDDFENKLFVLEKGDIVGLTGPKRIAIRKENEKVSLGSIFRFSKIKPELLDQELYFDYDEDQIVINYPSGNPDFDPVTLLFDKVQGLPYTALNLYIIPALTEAFKIIQDNDDKSYKEKRWFLILESILPQGEWSDDSFINAQKVIKTGLPINMAFDEIIKTKNLVA
jgi:hypothetical protein